MSTEIVGPTTFQKALLAVKHGKDKEFTDLFPGKGWYKVKTVLEYTEMLEREGYINPVKGFKDKITLTEKGKVELAKIGE